MDPRVGIPLHFTVEAIGLAVAGVTGTWAVLSRRWLAAGGAAAFAIAQTLYAGQFVSTGSGSAVAGTLRIAGVAAIAAGAWKDPDRPLLIGGAAVVAAGSLWRMLADETAASLPIGSRLVLAAGLAALIVWAARRANSSVRTRIVGAFLGIVAVAVVVSGGAAARVGVSDSVEDVQRRLEELAAFEQRRWTERSQSVLNRGALASVIVTQLGASDDTISDLRAQTFPDMDFLLYVDGSRQILSASDTGAPEVDVPSASAVTGANEGRPATSVVPGSGYVEAVHATPVYRRGGGRSAADVVGVLAVGERLTAEDISSRAIAGATVQFVGEGGVLAGNGTTEEPLPFAALGSREFASGEVVLDGEGHVASIARLNVTDAPNLAVGLAVPVSVAADVAAGFPRALVGGVLAAALLAVVIALWLSARLTQPILDLADEAERVKSEFLSTVSHELRTPLTPIRGYAELLRRPSVPRRRAEAYLDEIDVAAQRLERIVTLLVEVAAMQAGRLAIDRQPTDIEELLVESAKRWDERSPGHTFRVAVSKSLPQADADARAIKKVIDEMLDNAVKFSPDGGQVELLARRVKDGVEVTVKDQGIGMEPDQVGSLTAAFVQADPSETRRFGGLGLGLTYSAGVLAAHGARLVVVASPKGGAAFRFTLPAVGIVRRMPDRARSR